MFSIPTKAVTIIAVDKDIQKIIPTTLLNTKNKISDIVKGVIKVYKNTFPRLVVFIY